eukprot:gb/GECH01009265.1/.p1 GENE.gb/GECH01009265.1/~~gb/GECH01009265.1/.p1  ORF type:complete len:325 (+),score=39.87 gb/GECH01009265.1/:1-975(+)
MNDITYYFQNSRKIFNEFIDYTFSEAPTRNAVDENNPEEYPRLDDIRYFLIFLTTILCIRPIAYFFVVKPLAKWRARIQWREGKEKFTDEDTGKPLDNQSFENMATVLEPKMLDSSFKAIYYGISWLFGFCVCYQEGILIDTSRFWENFPYHRLTTNMRIYYMLSSAFYFASIFLTFVEVRRKDFGVMLFHHCATTILLLGSFVLRFYRVGLVVVVLHDFNDVFLETAKFTKYLGLQRVADPLFLFFAIGWFFTRFYVLLRVINSACTEIFDAFIYPPTFRYWYLLVFLLCFLFTMHVYWGFIILRIAIDGLRGKDMQDTREDE